MRRREFVALLGTGPILSGAGLEGWGKTPVIPAPEDPAAWPAFRESLVGWREEARRRLRYDDTLYTRTDFDWVTSSFACCFLMLCDPRFYDSHDDRYRVEEWLEEGDREFGGYDSVVLWHAYPRIGLDQRNQFDFYRDMPGGLNGLRDVARRFQQRGVHVYIDYNPWDTGTRREGASDLDAVVAMVKALGADGIFLDTMNKGAAEFRAKLDAVRPGVVLESEGALPLENVHDHHMSWAQGFDDKRVPGILRNKWLERRHMQHQIRRWNHDHTGELHAAWMNGSGIMVWENVFGSWVAWGDREKSILRSMLPIQRRYAALFSSEHWTPLVTTEKPDVYASLWEGAGLRLWTLVNRSDRQVSGPLLSVPVRAGERCFDLIAGTEVTPKDTSSATLLGGRIRSRGIGCYLAGTERSLGADFGPFLSRQREIDTRVQWHPVLVEMATGKRIVPAPPNAHDTPPGMVAIGPVSYEMRVEYRVRECGFYEPNEYTVGRGFTLHKPAEVSRKTVLGRYAIDLTPVTNAQYATFLKESGYNPSHRENFLKHWERGAPVPGSQDHPVVYVDLDDARAYAKWAGKRLPSEQEWQYAAEGPDRLRYPWGNEMKPGLCNGGERGGTTPVTAHPGGRSPFGCYDMCGNVWEWTESEYRSGHARFAILRGGSYFKASGSDWYMDGGPQPSRFAAKMLLMWPGLDRCATLGFRCAVDLASPARV